MSIETELHCIEVELQSIAESKERISAYKKELNKHNPFKIGEELEGNDSYSHNRKPFVVDSLSVSSQSSSVFMIKSLSAPKYFIAMGSNIKKDGSIGLQRVQRSIKITDVITQAK
jgi:hypothetical protein